MVCVGAAVVVSRPENKQRQATRMKAIYWGCDPAELAGKRQSEKDSKASNYKKEICWCVCCSLPSECVCALLG